MDKHNRHHKNKDKGNKKPQPSQRNSSVPQEPVAIKEEAATIPEQKPKSPGGKQK